MISRQEFDNIVKIKSISPELKVFTQNSYYATWLYGFSGHPIISPGLGDKNWNLEHWQEFWAGDATRQKEMLIEFKQPLLIYQDRLNSILLSEDLGCFKKVSPQFYTFDCK